MRNLTPALESVSPVDAVLDVTVLVLILLGAVLCLTAAIGLLRFTDVPMRLHAATKPQVLGLVLVLLGLALRLRSGPAVWMLVLVAVFGMLTSPVAAHMVGRAGYRTGKVRNDLLVLDELTEDHFRAPARPERSEADHGLDNPALRAKHEPDAPRA